MCNTCPAVCETDQSKMAAFGHVLQTPRYTPAKRSLESIVAGANKNKALKTSPLHKLTGLPRFDLKDKGLRKLRL